MPPARIPPSCGAAGAPAFWALPPLLPLSLLLLARLGADDPGIGRARPVGGFPRPGTACAPPTGGPAEEPDLLSIIGAERSFVTAFFNLAPLVMSPSKAPC